MAHAKWVDPIIGRRYGHIEMKSAAATGSPLLIGFAPSLLVMSSGDLKRTALLFDRVASADLFWAKSITNHVDPARSWTPTSASFQEIEWLSDVEFLFDPFEPFSVGAHQFGASALLPKRAQDLISPELPPTALIDGYWLHRGMATRLAATGVCDAMTIAQDDNLASPPSVSNDLQRVGVADVIIQQFPQVLDNVAWEEVIAFREMEETRLKLVRLRTWLARMSHASLQPREIREAILSAVSDYEETMKLNRLRYSYGPIRLFLSIVPDLLESMLRLRPTQAAKSLLAISERKILLLEEERNAPGRALAYIPYTASNFSDRSK